MTFDTATKIYEQIENTELKALKNDLVRSAVEYARQRADFRLATYEERRQMSEPRTRSHNRFIDACNILSRNQAKSGESNEWRKLMGDDRKEIGDFACHLHAILGLQAR